MGIITKYFAACLLLVSTFNACLAQQETVVKDGKKYKVVKIKAKQTLYSLSKEYAVSADEIKSANGGLPEGLKVGATVFIPSKGGGVVDAAKVSVHNDVAVDANSEMPQEKEEDKLKIIRDFYKAVDTTQPQLPDVPCPVPSKIDEEKLNDASYLKVAFILPFQLALVDSLHVQKKEYQDFQIPLEVQVFVDFYEGALIALDSLKKQGFKILVSVYDDHGDSVRVKKILARSEFEHMDLIIGPAYSSCVKVAASICAQKKIYMVSAFSKNNDLIDNNPYVIKTIPSRKSLLLALMENALKTYPEGKMILVGEGENSRKNCEVISTAMTEKALNASTVKVNASKLALSIDELKLSLSKEKMNVVFMPTENEAFATRFLNSLFKLTKDYQIVVYGMENWKDFSGVDVLQYQTLNVHLPATNLVRYDYALNDKMIRSYVRRFKTEPSDFAYAGYDITSIFLKTLKKNKDFGSDSFLNKKWVGTMSDFYFVRKNANSGIENTSIGVMLFNNYQLVWSND